MIDRAIAEALEASRRADAVTQLSESGTAHNGTPPYDTGKYDTEKEVGSSIVAVIPDAGGNSFTSTVEDAGNEPAAAIPDAGGGIFGQMPKTEEAVNTNRPQQGGRGMPQGGFQGAGSGFFGNGQSGSSEVTRHERGGLGSLLSGLLGGSGGGDLMLYALAFTLFNEKADNDLLLALLYVIMG